MIESSSGIFVDGTLGGGGHSEAILKQLSHDGRLIAIDQDDDAIAFAQDRLRVFEDKLTIVKDNFVNIHQVLERLKVKAVDGLLLDLGVSSWQIDEAQRGFSYLNDGPLDMRMNQHQHLTAAEIVNTWSEKELADLIYIYGEERASRKIARTIVRQRNENDGIQTTGELSSVIRSVIPYNFQNKTLSRVFQAFRIAVNQEMDVLINCLRNVYPYLKKGARVVIISYHSLEDRLIKYYFRGDELSFLKQKEYSLKTNFNFQVLTRKAVLPSEEEIARNSRARSAKLRAAIKR